MQFTKSEGLTESERVLAGLCERSFLNLWTYPNLYKKRGKEFADLMVVFGENVLLFSDKSCVYPKSRDSDLDWQRWFRRAIANSAHQLRQAERWLKAKRAHLYLDAKATEQLPLTLPDPTHLVTHRICVVTGAAQRCIEAMGQAGLAIDMSVIDDSVPLTVGRVTKADGWLHVFDQMTLEAVLFELSTVTDFVEYLNAKTELWDNGMFQAADNEMDLLAYYLWNGRNFLAETERFRLEPNLWLKLEADRGFQMGRERNRVSAFWDRLIEYVTDHFLAQTLEFGNKTEMGDYERLVRLMASESRFHRRVLSQAILDRAERAREHKIGSLLPSENPETVYALLIGQGAPRSSYDEYRTDRAHELQLRCLAAKAARPECRYIIGIALDAIGANGSSEDFAYIDTGAWSAEDLNRAQRLRTELQLFIPGTAQVERLVEDEYPPE